MTFDVDLKASVRTISDYPKPGILFRDITTLLADARRVPRAVDELVHPWPATRSTRSPASRRAASSWAARSPIRSQPDSCRSARRASCRTPTVRIAYSLEYGIDEMEMHVDAIHPGERVDPGRRPHRDGGTAEARKLCGQIGANVVAACSSSTAGSGWCRELRAWNVPVRPADGVRGH